MGELLLIHLTVHVLAASGLTLRMRLRSHWLLSEWIATVLRPVTLATASHSRSAPSLQSTNTTTGGWYSLLSCKATRENTGAMLHFIWHLTTLPYLYIQQLHIQIELLCILTYFLTLIYDLLIGLQGIFKNVKKKKKKLCWRWLFKCLDRFKWSKSASRWQS